MPLFRLFSVERFCDFKLATVIIVGVRSTACNHGHISRGYTIIQSTTCHSLIRSESLSPINRLRLYRPVTSCGSVCVLASLTIFALTSGTFAMTDVAASDVSIKKRATRDFGPSLGSALCIVEIRIYRKQANVLPANIRWVRLVMICINNFIFQPVPAEP